MVVVVVIKWAKHSFLLHLSCLLLKKRNIEGGRIRVQQRAGRRKTERRDREKESDMCQLRPPGVLVMIEGEE